MTNSLPAGIPNIFVQSISLESGDKTRDLVSTAVSRATMKAGQAGRKRALGVMSIALIVAVSCIILVIGTSTVEAGMPTYTVTKALSAKQDDGIAAMATVSIIFAAFGAVALFSSRR